MPSHGTLPIIQSQKVYWFKNNETTFLYSQCVRVVHIQGNGMNTVNGFDFR